MVVDGKPNRLPFSRTPATDQRDALKTGEESVVFVDSKPNRLPFSS